jgi:two-component system response regulator MtrA
MAEQILVIEDDEALGAQVVRQLREASYAPSWLKVGRLLTRDECKPLQLVILDLMLPGTYGLDILKALREHSDVPVLVLSARIDAADKARALQLGADDYLAKPFWPGELIERVKARLRRPVLQRADRLEVGELVIDIAAHDVKLAGKPVDLTRVEFAILVALARRPGQAVTRHGRVEHVPDPERAGSERTLDVHVSRLRKKLSDGGIETVWGVGYRLGSKA